MSEVVVVDLGMGNLRSVVRACERHDAKVTIESDPDAIRRAPRLIVPGQGAFRECARHLEGDLGSALRDAIRSGRPFLGICLGMQALFEESEEAPGEAGLAIFKGRVRKFAFDAPAGTRRRKVPHMGWNQIESEHPLLRGEDWYYFVHSYYCDPADSALSAAVCNYGAAFCAAVARDNILAVQFHPEKSHNAGHRLLGKFLAPTWS